MKNYLLLLLALVSGTASAGAIRDGDIVSRMLNSETQNSALISNLGLAVTVSGNALTISVKQKDASTAPTVLSPVSVAFRNATATTGDFTLVKITAALTLVIPASTTIGTVSAVAETYYVYLINNAGTAELAVSLSSTFGAGSVFSTTSISGGTSRVTAYSTTGRSNLAGRLIAKFTATEATAGTYATAPSEISLLPFNQPLVSDSTIRLDQSTGRGSTNTLIHKFTNSVVTGTGTVDYTYTSDASLGDKITVNTAGIYGVLLSTNHNGGGGVFCYSVNNSSIASSCNGTLTYAQGFRGSCNPAANSSCVVYGIEILAAGDILRTGSDGSNLVNDTMNYFKITRLK